MYVIEKDVPIPELAKRPGVRVYPFPDMAIGDSFRAPLEMRDRLGSAAAAYAKKTGTKFTVRRTGDDCVHVFRVE